MPGEVTTIPGPVGTTITPKSLSKMREARASSSASSAMSFSSKLVAGCAKEFMWGCQLTKEKNEFKWTFEEEEDDQDFLQHTLFLRHVVLGSGAPKDERNVVEIETRDFNGDDLKLPIAVVSRGHDMAQLDMNFSHEIPVTFRLSEGSGPVYLSAQHLVEFPNELNESEYTATETDFTDDDEVEEEEEVEDKKGVKRKGGDKIGAKKKRGKIDSECAEEDEDDEDEEEEEEEDEEEEEEEEESMEEDEESEPESSPEKKKKKGKKGKAAPAKSKKEKAAPVVAKGKKGKKGKGK